jgi:membrane dipeptidase
VTDSDPIQQAKDLHQAPILFDLHADTFYRIENQGGTFEITDGTGHIDLPRLCDLGCVATTQAVYTPKDLPGAAGTSHALTLTARILTAVTRNDSIHLIRHSSDLDRDGIGLLLHLEGVSPLEGDLDRLHLLSEIGFRSIGLTHNHANEAAGGCSDQSSTRGLTPFGRELLTAMETLGIALDVAHLGDAALEDVFDLATRPFYTSHTGLRSRCDVPRNLSDTALDEIVGSGGIIAIDFVPEHLTGENIASVEDIFIQIDQVVDRHGPQFVAIGSDFDGYHSPTTGMEGIQDIPNLTARMYAAGYPESAIRQILGDNATKFFRTLLPEPHPLS